MDFRRSKADPFGADRQPAAIAAWSDRVGTGKRALDAALDDLGARFSRDIASMRHETHILQVVQVMTAIVAWCTFLSC